MCPWMQSAGWPWFPASAGAGLHTCSSVVVVVTPGELLNQNFGTVSDLVRAHSVERPAAVALISGADQISYAELDQQMDKVAAGLQREGLGSGDIIASVGRLLCGIPRRAPSRSRCGSPSTVVNARDHCLNGR